MKRSTTHYAIFGSAALALVLGLGQTISVQAEEPTTSSTQPDQGVQERAVPRMMNPDAHPSKCNRLQECARDLFGRGTISLRGLAMCWNQDRTIK